MMSYKHETNERKTSCCVFFMIILLFKRNLNTQKNKYKEKDGMKVKTGWCNLDQQKSS